MRNLKQMLKAFVGIAAVAALGGCEEEDVPPKPQPVVSQKLDVQKPIEQPKVETKVETKVEPPKIEAKNDDADDEAADDETLEPKEMIDEARASIDRGEIDHAMKLAHLATIKAPRRSGAWNTLGRVQLMKGQRKDAIASFEKAVELNPSSSWAQNNLGLALIYDGRYDDAIDALEEATELEPVEGYMWNNLGMAYEHQDRLDEARDAYRKAAELKNDRAEKNFARLSGVKSIRTAKADPQPLPIVGEPMDGGAK